VSATRVEQQLSDVLPSATVITREEIERAQAPTLVDLLQGQPGIEIGRNGGPGSVASIFMRGQNSVNVAIFIDGVRVQTDAIGSLKLIDLPPSQIERVEILRGNMSAIYGEAATGGVINIYTRSGAGSAGGHASLTYGSRNTFNASAGYHVNQDDWKAGFSVYKFDTDGYSAQNVQQAPLANPDKDGYERDAVFLNLEKTIRAGLSFGVQANFIDSKAEYDSSSALSGDLPSHSHFDKTKSNDVTLFSKFKLNQEWSSRLGVTQSDFSYDQFRNRGAGFVNTSKSKGDQLSLDWSNIYKLGQGHATFGVDAVNAEFKSGAPSSLMKYKRNSNGYYLGYSGGVGALDYQANARQDTINARSSTKKIKKTKPTWLLAVGYQLTDELKLTAMHSTSFRAPAVEELFDSAWTKGNPSLEPEAHRGREIGFSYQTRIGAMRVVHFDTETTNAIAYDPGAESDYFNIGRVKNKGLELSFIGDTAGWGYRISAVSQNPKNAETGVRMARRAKEYATIDVTTSGLGIDWGANLIWSGSRKDSDFSRHINKSYTRINLLASKKLTPVLTGRLKVENAFNESYQLVRGFDAVPRGIFFTLDYRPR
jgi:vitamin B12 transporter